MINSIAQIKRPFFVGIAGTGMSAIAQYLQGIGMQVSGSDRYFNQGEAHDIKEKLTNEGILCHNQNAGWLNTTNTDLLVCSTAIEDTVPEVLLAKAQGIPIIKRSELLALIALSKKTIAIGGTSGKSTTCAMLYNILVTAGLQPSIISGAGLVSIINEGKIGNAKVGSGAWLVIEADESDGSIVQYKAAVGLLLNVDKDHKDIETLMQLFEQFKHNSKHFIVNQSHYLAKQLSSEVNNDFSITMANAGTMASNFEAKGLAIQFLVNNTAIHINAIGRHTMENATAAIAVALHCGATLQHCATALAAYQGIYRRHQIIGQKNNLWLIDDYGHNPVKCAASIAACQPLSTKVIAWFQPHGYGPTKFLRADFVSELAAVLRPTDVMVMSEIYYAGGTTVKDISANDLIQDLQKLGKNALFINNRKDLVTTLQQHHIIGDNEPAVLLLMGARDPSLEGFAAQVWAWL